MIRWEQHTVTHSANSRKPNDAWLALKIGTCGVLIIIIIFFYVTRFNKVLTSIFYLFGYTITERFFLTKPVLLPVEWFHSVVEYSIHSRSLSLISRWPTLQKEYFYQKDSRSLYSVAAQIIWSQFRFRRRNPHVACFSFHWKKKKM